MEAGFGFLLFTAINSECSYPVLLLVSLSPGTKIYAHKLTSFNRLTDFFFSA
ncbi:hypothetical protein FORC066_4320 [Yersinia enterocolitica]|nr:hypothetical protein FORC066_4320 [Yersinia enterocolitica]